MNQANLNKLASRIGFMQGRLSPQVDGKIQAFPWKNWCNEFSEARQLGLKLMEWTLDQENLVNNPLMGAEGRQEIQNLMDINDVTVPSLTGDCFMQAPFWKTSGARRNSLITDFLQIAYCCNSLGIRMIVVPLVDNGAIENESQKEVLIAVMKDMQAELLGYNIKIVFESDFAPKKLAYLINSLDPSVFGINYDVGNSAALGFDSSVECNSFGDRIMNVHIKDRLLGGGTVPLGMGNVNFEDVFYSLNKIGYKGNYIMQTARDPGGKHSEVLGFYRDLLIGWMHKYEI
jgi:hexulose-6-phosphate isomerase